MSTYRVYLSYVQDPDTQNEQIWGDHGEDAIEANSLDEAKQMATKWASETRPEKVGEKETYQWKLEAADGEESAKGRVTVIRFSEDYARLQALLELASGGEP